jgi:hypothetical protein
MLGKRICSCFLAIYSVTLESGYPYSNPKNGMILQIVYLHVLMFWL